MPNRLLAESSPYLRQHADNPVDWYAWGPEALGRARAEGKPILLSVGYSACHWCHVMEHESFSDAEVAAQMNRDFVSIKVDREERPDLDEIYMQAVQAFTGGHGGWPMTVFLTPDGKPYFGGTYFPPERRGRMPSFREVLRHAATIWKDRRAEAEDIGSRVVDALGEGPQRGAPTAALLREDWLDRIAEDADRTYDHVDGGFGGAPKFPPHGTLAALLAHHARRHEPRSLEMVTGTLDGMIKGGMYDHVGGGFARYSVDARWVIPHFEKMLYDNAQLVPVLLDAHVITGRATYARIARESLDFILRELTAPEGAFYSAFDADSEGHEGKFYVWTPAQIRDAVGLLDGLRVATLLGVTDAGSFEDGTSVIRLERPIEEHPEDAALITRSLRRLHEVRSTRVPPSRDDKIVTAWNGLTISAFAKAARTLGEPRYQEAASRAMRWLLDHHVDGGLMRTGKVTGFLDDHGALIDALIDLYETDFDVTWLRQALAWADRTVERFADPSDNHVPFFFTSKDAETLIVRSKKLIGGAEPAGNALIARAFTRLEHLCGRPDLGARAEGILRAYEPYLLRAPRALGIEAVAAAWMTGPVQEIALIGPKGQAMDDLLGVLRRRHLPFAVVARIDAPPAPIELPWLEERFALEGNPTAWVCEAFACKLPVTTAGELAAQLEPEAPVVGRGRLHAPELPSDPSAWFGDPLTLEKLRGNVVVLDFWTFCCINCMHVLPELDAIETRFAGQPVAVIGVHSAKFTAEKDRGKIALALARHHVRHPVVNDAGHDLWDRYAVRSWPTIVVLDAEGRIAWQKAGEVTREELGTQIERLLAEAHAAGTLGTPLPAPHRPAPEGLLSFPGKLTADRDRLYVADTGHHRIIEAALAHSADGWPYARLIRTFGGPDPGLVDGAEPRFRDPQGVSRQGDTLWVADTGNHALRAIDLATGQTRTAAGTGRLGRSGSFDPDQPRRIDLRSPWDVAAVEGVVFIAMAGTHQIWVHVEKEGRTGPLVGSGVEDHVDGPPEEAALAQPSGLALAGRYLVWADSETSSIRLMDLEQREVGTVVGEGLFDFGDKDGPIGEAMLQHPLGVALSGTTVWVADTFNDKVKAIDLGSGQVRTIATGLLEPGGLVTWGEFVLVADTGHHRIVAVRDGQTREVPLHP